MITVNVLRNHQVIDRLVVDNGEIKEGVLPSHLERTAAELTGGGESSLMNLERYVLWAINSTGNRLSLRRGSGLQLVPPDQDPQPEGGFESTQTVNPIAPVMDSAEESDLGDLLTEKSIAAIAPVIKRWSTVTKNWLGKTASVEEAKSKLADDPESLYKLLPFEGFQNVLEQSMLLSAFAGQSEVLDEDSRGDSIRVDAPRRPEWFKLPFLEAIAYFRQKLNVPVESYYDMEEGYHDWAFSIAHMTRGDWLESARFLIDQALQEGNSLKTFTRQWNRLIGRQGWTTEGDRDRRIYTIFDTNVRSAYANGRAKQMYDPDVLSRRPLLVWRWRDSPNPRLNHQALNNKAIPADSKFWKKCSMPAGFGCRCAVFSVSEDYAKRNGIEILSNPPDPETIAEPGFRYPLTGLTDSDRQAMIDRTLDRLSPNVKALVQKDLQSRSGE